MAHRNHAVKKRRRMRRTVLIPKDKLPQMEGVTTVREMALYSTLARWEVRKRERARQTYLPQPNRIDPLAAKVLSAIRRSNVDFTQAVDIR